MRQVLLVDKVVGQLEIGVEDGIRGRDRSAWTEGMGHLTLFIRFQEIFIIKQCVMEKTKSSQNLEFIRMLYM